MTCVDCHEPHAQRYRDVNGVALTGRFDNGQCLGCHPSKAEPIELTFSTDQTAYVYCYVQSPANGKIQRIFPNRFARDPHVDANTPITLPGAQGFKVVAGAEGVRQQVVGCLAADREVYNDLPPSLRWGDFEDIRLGTLDEIREAFAQVSKGPVSLDAAVIDVSEK